MIRALIPLGLILLIAQIHRSAGGVLALEFSAARGLSPAAIGTIIGIMPLASACVQIPTGMALDRFGVRRTLSTLVLLGSLGTLGFALAETATQLAMARIVIGVGFAASMSSIYLISMSWTSPQRMGMIVAVLVSAPGSIGAMLGTAPLSLAFAAVGWLTTFTLIASASAMLALAALLLIRDGPQGRPAREPTTLADNLRTLREIVGHRDLQRIMVMSFCFAGPFMAVGGLWAGPYLRDIHGFGQTAAGTAILILVIAYNVGTLAMGYLERRLGTRKWVVLGAAGVTITIYAVFAFAPRLPLPLALPLLILCALSGPYFILLAGHCRAFVPASRAGRTVTTIMLAGIAGTFFMQWATGLAMEVLQSADGAVSLAGYRAVFALPASVLALCALVYLPVREGPAGDQPLHD